MLASEDTDGARTAPRFSLAGDIVELVVLTTDESFLQTLREAVGASRRLWHVPAADKVGDLLVAGGVGILVLDAQALSPESRPTFISEIQRQFPDLVVIVAGTRDVEGALARLISAGTVYRFIHKPMSPGRARLFTDAAVRKYIEHRRRTGPRPAAAARSDPMRWIGGAAAAGAALIAVIVVGARHGMQVEGAAAPSTPAAASQTSVTDAPDRLMQQAENALRAQFAKSLEQHRGSVVPARPQTGLESGAAATPEAPPGAAHNAVQRSAEQRPQLERTVETAEEPALVQPRSPASIIDAAELTLVKSVPPVYPQGAERAAIEGWVDLEFTVTETGETRDVTVRAAAPSGTFDQAAVEALSQWRYQPVVVEGKPAARRARARIRFSLPH